MVLKIYEKLTKLSILNDDLDGSCKYCESNIKYIQKSLLATNDQRKKEDRSFDLAKLEIGLAELYQEKDLDKMNF